MGIISERSSLLTTSHVLVTDATDSDDENALEAKSSTGLKQYRMAHESATILRLCYILCRSVLTRRQQYLEQHQQCNMVR
jgi:hypothetical protein